MTADPPSRRRSRALAASPGARRAGACIFLSPVDHRVLRVPAHPDDRDVRCSRSRTSTSHQAEPLRFVGPATTTTRCSTTSRPGSRWGSPSSSPRSPCRSRSSCRSSSRCSSAAATSRRPGIFRILFFMPYVVPFVAGVLIWQAMLNPDSGWIDASSEVIGDRRTRPNWLQDPTLDLPGPRPHRRVGHRRRGHRLPRRAQGHPDRAVRRGPDRRRGLVGEPPPRDPADDLAGHLLHADPGHRRPAPVLPRPARAQPTAPASRAARRCS